MIALEYLGVSKINKMSDKSVLEFGLVFETDFNGKINYILNLIKLTLNCPYKNVLLHCKNWAKNDENCQKFKKSCIIIYMASCSMQAMHDAMASFNAENDLTEIYYNPTLYFLA